MTVLYLCGAGNCEAVRLAHAVNHAHRYWDRIVLLDDDASKHGLTILGVEVIGPFARLGHADPARSQVVNLVARNTVGRWQAHERIAAFGIPFTSLVSPDVDVTGVTLADDVTIYQNVILGPSTTVGPGSVIFMGAMLGNGSRMGSGCVVAPNAVLNARVQLGDGVYVGTNAAVLPDARIGPWATIGACSAVLRSVPAGATVMGVPAKVVMTLDQKLRLGGGKAFPAGIRATLEAVAP